MPTYDYKCKQCSMQFEANHPINVGSQNCPECGAEAKKIILVAPASHGYMAEGREQAMRSLQPIPRQSKHTHSAGCGCGCGQHH